MLKPVVISIALAGLVGARAARAQWSSEPNDTSVAVAAKPQSPEPAHPNPRLKLSYRQFAIANVASTDVPLHGAQLDIYPLSRRWLRGGLEVEAGTGHASVNTSTIDVRYGLLGVSAGVQYPARITPFVEARAVAGVLGGTVDGTVAIPGSSVSLGGASAVTWIYGRGVDAGAELFTVGRAYVSASIGWLRTTWYGIDYAAMVADPQGGLRFKDLSSDGFTFKLGLGI